MSPLSVLVYRSVATHEPSPYELEALLLGARAFNAHSGVTGVLLVQGGQFMQYLEGPPAALEAVFARVLASPLHTDVQVLHRGSVPQRAFDTWHMALAQVPASAFLELAQADWQQDMSERPPPGGTAPLAGVLAAWRQFGG